MAHAELMSRAALVLAALLTATPLGAAAQDPASAALPGRVAPTGLQVRDARLPRAQASQMAAEVERVLFGPLLATPQLADPHGFAIGRQLIISPPTDGTPQTGPAVARGHMLVRAINVSDGSKPDAQGRYGGAGEGPGISFSVNDLSALYPWPQGEADTFYDLDPTPELRGGFPILRFRTKEHIVIAKPGRKPYRHVTKAEVLEREIAERAKTIAQFGAETRKGVLDDQAKQQAELAALSPAERNAPACLGNSRKRGTFMPCGDSSANYVVVMDPGYFDPKLPKTALQLVVLTVGAQHRDEHKWLGPMTRQAVAALDLDAIQAALR
jgi:hypothetical protein